MAKTIKITTFLKIGEDVIRASGTCDGKEFTAQTIMYGPKGDKQPIFKVLEEGQVALSLAKSSFSRGERIAIARKLKLHRLEWEKQDTSELTKLSVKELRTRCKSNGLKGYWKKGVRKADLVAILAA
tara:strand:- start:1162 stop:1542 length:381 start_codon:yes stop_codon:yes gene_type:complete